ncbi:membrane-bound lytic murein transglycosylase A [Desulfarculales bacterium]
MSCKRNGSAHRWLSWWACLALAFLLAGCAKEVPLPSPTPAPSPAEKPTVALEIVTEDQWPLLADDLDPGSFHEACQQSLTYLRRLPADKPFDFGVRFYSAVELIAGLMRLQDVLVRFPEAKARTEALKREFILLRSVGFDGQGRVLFTGYYEPILIGRKSSVPPFVYPLYAVPGDLANVDLSQFGEDLPRKKLVGQVKEHQVRPYPDREAIDFDGAIKGQAEPLAYLDDMVEAFFLHIQGSGQVKFPDGSRTRLGFAASNGRSYRSIGSLLADEGLMNRDEMSMQDIKALLAQRPELRRRVLSQNPSYVFFRKLSPEGGPLGCFEMPLTPGRSVALDRRVFPGLAPGFILGTRPAQGGGTAPFARFILNQDTGGAIRGPGRLDLYFGSGSEAELLAGRMKHAGQLFFFALKRR